MQGAVSNGPAIGVVETIDVDRSGRVSKATQSSRHLLDESHALLLKVHMVIVVSEALLPFLPAESRLPPKMSALVVQEH